MRWQVPSGTFFEVLANMMLGSFDARFVGPFMQPVDPKVDGVPDYFEKITTPMDLGTMKEKMDWGEYASEEEFLTDMRRIFGNCYTYWPRLHIMRTSCQRLQEAFNDRYREMDRWIAKNRKDLVAVVPRTKGAS
jgi:hypothetical protein